MKKPRPIALLFGFGLLLAVVIFLAGSREPSYKGRSLSSWVGIRGKEALYTQPSDYEDAMRHMGSNAIPYLLRWIQDDKPRLRERMANVLDKLGMRISYEPRFTGSLFASALAYIGPDAEVAIPHLSNLVQTSGSEIIAERAAVCLAWLGDKGIPPLLTVITNQNAKFRGFCIFALTTLGTNAAPVVPTVIRCLKDNDPEVAYYAATTLGDLRIRPDVVVPALAEIIRLQNSRIRANAAQALGQFGHAAEGATGILIEAGSDPDSSLRDAAKIALVRIAPGAVTNTVPK